MGGRESVHQGAKVLPRCTENVCASCVPTARSKEPQKLEGREQDKPVVYVGETSGNSERK